MLKEKIFSHFQSQFMQTNYQRPTMDGIHFSRISDAENSILMAEFTKEEIKAAVWGCEGNSCPGPDGYNFIFIKRFWNVVGNDFFKMVEDFHRNASLVKGCNASFVVLVPKKENPTFLNDYRPISLVGCMYKVIAKLLAARLGKVMPSIIS